MSERFFDGIVHYINCTLLEKQIYGVLLYPVVLPYVLYKLGQEQRR